MMTSPAARGDMAVQISRLSTMPHGHSKVQCTPTYLPADGSPGKKSSHDRTAMPACRRNRTITSPARGDLAVQVSRLSTMPLGHSKVQCTPTYLFDHGSPGKKSSHDRTAMPACRRNRSITSRARGNTYD